MITPHHVVLVWFIFHKNPLRQDAVTISSTLIFENSLNFTIETIILYFSNSVLIVVEPQLLTFFFLPKVC